MMTDIEKSNLKEVMTFLFQRTNDLMIVLDQDFVFLWFNNMSTMGYSKEEIEGRNALEFIHPNDKIYSLGEVKKKIEINKKFEVRLLHKNGNYKWFEAWGFIFEDDIGNLKYLFIFKDLTFTKQIKSDLIKSELKYRSLFNNITFLIFILDLNGIIVDFNKTVEKYGYINNDLLGKNFRDLNTIIPKESFQFLIKKYHKFLYNERIDPFEIQLYDKEKNLIWTNLQAKIINIENEKFIQIIIEDIRKRKKSEQRYRLITENANDLIVILNNKFKFEFINENTHRRIMGYSKEDLIDQSALSFVYPDDIERGIYILKEGFKNGEGEGEVRVKNKSGNYVWLQVKGKIFIDDDGKEKAILISRDITDKKIAEQKLIESEIKYRSFFENIKKEGIYELDLFGNFVFFKM